MTLVSAPFRVGEEIEKRKYWLYHHKLVSAKAQKHLNMNKLILYTSLIFLTCSCGSSKSLIVDEEKVNTNLNNKYIESRESLYGILDNEQYQETKNLIEEALGTKIPEGKSILINYEQAGKNCLTAKWEPIKISGISDRGRQISNNMCKQHNAVDFFIYNDNSFFKNVYESLSYYQIDHGFFQNTIFTKNDNCSAFFILKPNGEFMKYYGEDYYSEADKFFNQEIEI